MSPLREPQVSSPTRPPTGHRQPVHICNTVDPDRMCSQESADKKTDEAGSSAGRNNDVGTLLYDDLDHSENQFDHQIFFEPICVGHLKKGATRIIRRVVPCA